MKIEVIFNPIDEAATDQDVISGFSMIVAVFDVKGKRFTHSHIAGWVNGMWRYHGRELKFEPTHYTNPRKGIARD